MIRAQSSYSLSDCIRIATTENARVRQAQVAVETADAAREGSIYAYIPSLALSNQHGLSTGRALDPTTYQFVTSRSVYDMSASIGGSMTLFSGLERYHGIQNARVDLATAKNQLSIDKLFQAQAQRLQAKYEYLFRLKMVDFYSGKPL